MFDLRAIRSNPDAFDVNWARRGLKPQTPAILKLDEDRRSVQTDLQNLQQKRNELSKQIGQIKSQGGDSAALMDEVAAIKAEMETLDAKEKALAQELNDILMSLPNQLQDSVPEGADESGNVETKSWGTPVPNADAKDHVFIGEALGMMDFGAAAKMSGARFVWLEGQLARLERALGLFMLDLQTQKNGFTEVSPPLLVKDDAMYGTGQLPKFREDQFRAAEDYWLIPTAEVTLTNYVSDEIVDAARLPLRFAAHTPCFRLEAGSAGKDTRGMIRMHQFYKVEMVSITAPEESEAEHERMTLCAEAVLEALEIPYRRIVLCAGDTGFGATKTYDIEVWLPGQQTYREISSCSNCKDFQARRMKARFRKNKDSDVEHLHTLNGSGLAVGRTLVAVMENYYDAATNTLNMPKVLQPYMGGQTKIEAAK